MRVISDLQLRPVLDIKKPRRRPILTDVDLRPGSSPEDHLLAGQGLQVLLLLEDSVGTYQM